MAEYNNRNTLTRAQLLSAYWDLHPATLQDPTMAPSLERQKQAWEVMEQAYAGLGIKSTDIDSLLRLREVLNILNPSAKRNTLAGNAGGFPVRYHVFLVPAIFQVIF